MNEAIKAYNKTQSTEDSAICDTLAQIITNILAGAEGKIWHAHPVWFLERNPIVGYSKQKAGIRLMFWSGAGFEEDQLNIKGLKFKDASIVYTAVEHIAPTDLQRWLIKSSEIQWDYINIIKRKGQLERLK